MPVGRHTKQLSENEVYGLHRFFGDLEVVDAKKELRIQPSLEDIETAIPEDPHNCVFSRACQRMWGSTAVLFFGTIAYVDLLTNTGKRRIERFKISSEGQRFIQAVDSKKKKVAPAGFLLLPPSRSLSLEGKRQVYSEYLKRKKEALLVGKSKPKHGIRPKPKTVRLAAFRNGSGMVHFPAADDAS
jgi:hypothetical protein